MKLGNMASLFALGMLTAITIMAMVLTIMGGHYRIIRIPEKEFEHQYQLVINAIGDEHRI